MARRSVAIVLHAHLPWVLGHGRWPHGSEWVCEAAAETYLPLLRMLGELADENLPVHLTIGLSPVLCEQLVDQRFQIEFRQYIEQKLAAAEHDTEDFLGRGLHGLRDNAAFWTEFYTETKNHYERIGGNIVGALRTFQDTGILEILTCGATHAYFPLLSRDETISAQTKAAVANYKKHFDRDPRGIWLPECGYRPGYRWRPPAPINGVYPEFDRQGIESILAENNLEFFVVESALMAQSNQPGSPDLWHDTARLAAGLSGFGAISSAAAVHTRGTDTMTDLNPHRVYRVTSNHSEPGKASAFIRDPETGSLVWSGAHGYPGDQYYLEFHKKHSPGGLRYWAVTSQDTDLGKKVEYRRELALGRARVHAFHFASEIENTLSGADDNAILVAPYDAELFGHWWFEGPQFLKDVLRRVAYSDTVHLTSLSGYLDDAPPQTTVTLSEGSWGFGGGHFTWINDRTEWSWPMIYEAEDRVARLVARWRRQPASFSQPAVETLRQMARQLMLMAASDWQFLITSGTAVTYGTERLNEHYRVFQALNSVLCHHLMGSPVSAEDQRLAEEAARRDTLLPELDLTWFA